MLSDLAIFPLNTVLFPGGVLPLRIFEPRYMDMVRDCMTRDRPFGVCLITSGGEIGEAAEHESLGCSARIADWEMEQLGVLQLRAIGGDRFRIQARRVQQDNLVRADARALDQDPPTALSSEFAPCADLLRRLVEERVESEVDPMKRMIAAPYQFESAVWVGNRLCEFLPISPKARQGLMALDDPLARLSVVRQYLQQHRLI
jgi:Lon protease-like protein